jgi:hypothetical protein
MPADYFIGQCPARGISFIKSPSAGIKQTVKSDFWATTLGMGRVYNNRPFAAYSWHISASQGTGGGKSQKKGLGKQSSVVKREVMDATQPHCVRGLPNTWAVPTYRACNCS